MEAKFRCTIVQPDGTETVVLETEYGSIVSAGFCGSGGNKDFFSCPAVDSIVIRDAMNRAGLNIQTGLKQYVPPTEVNGWECEWHAESNTVKLFSCGARAYMSHDTIKALAEVVRKLEEQNNDA